MAMFEPLEQKPHSGFDLNQNHLAKQSADNVQLI
jgi:hypothetical protein